MKKSRLYFKYPVGFFNDAQLLYEGEGTGGGSSDNAPPPKDPVVTAAKYNNDVNAMARHINTLETENFNLRGDKRTLKAELEEAQKKVPEGSLVLTKEQAADWESYQKLGKPADIEKIKEDSIFLQRDAAAAKRLVLINDISRSVEPGIVFDPQVMRDLDAQLSGVEYLQKETEQDGEKIKKWYAKYEETEGDKKTQKETSVLDFYKNKFPKYMPSLTDTTNSQNNGMGAFFPEQELTGVPPANSDTAMSRIIDSRYTHMLPQKKS